MRNKFFSIITLLLCIVLAVPNVGHAYSLDYTSDYSLNEVFFPEDLFYDEDFRGALREYLEQEVSFETLINQDISLANLQNLLNSFPQTRMGITVYPDYYGGAYLDDSGHLVLLTSADLNNTSFARARNMISTTIREVEYSFNEMMDVTNLILEFFSANSEHPISLNMTSWGPDVMRNRVTVDILEYNEEQISLFRELIIDSPMVEFNQSSGMAVPTEYIPTTEVEYEQNIEPTYAPIMPFNIALNPGQRITRANGIGGRSIGYRATRNGVNGFVTASHTDTGHISIVERFYSAGRHIGTTVTRSSGSTDAAFVSLQAGTTVSNRIGSSEAHGRTIFRPVAGAWVARIGSTSGINGGQITHAGRTGIVNGSPVWVAEASFISREGDSGGIVFRENFSNVSSHEVAGITVAAYGNSTFFTHAEMINSQLGLTLH